MSKRPEFECLNDIIEAIQRISRYLESMSYADFRQDTKTQDAVIRNIEIIGEATKGITEELRTKNAHIPWKNMVGMRDRLIHHYFGINLDIVWQVVAADLPLLLPELFQISKAIEDENTEEG